MIKKLINKVVGITGYNFNKKYNQKTYLDNLLKLFIKKNDPVILDIGANKGQSVERFQSIFKDPYIYSFEPVKSCFNLLKKKIENKKRFKAYNIAICKNNKKKKIYIYENDAHSSFHKVLEDTKWLKLRSKKINTSPKKYLKKAELVSSETIDNFCKKNKIKNIDILKIDTQGNEDNVLKGCRNLLKQKRIKVIQVEIILQDVYNKYLNIYDIEKYLIPNSYRLLATNKFGNLIDNYSFQMDILYTTNHLYKKIKKNY
tara:strand:- start:20982 stop:21755 length:774 start_codon:yes stop_codon:yes gene_type:complete